MWDYGAKQAMLDAMKRQCSLSLRWLRRPIEGVVFLASCTCDLGLEAVVGSRWIGENGQVAV
ncbi:hypothetical protein AYO40_00705 [Planctomycetaceae bacterium SCGC AG-212-D15]|nr:hypothetical protein AYO40_00705 [Planctomycetaceae bacterium SCGC AG-212-D15]